MAIERLADADMEKIVERVRKLLALAGKNPNQEEAAAALAKAQEYLAAYNLDLATIGQGGDSGKREEARQFGGMYVYERELWKSIALLNWCWYFHTRGVAQEGRGRKTSFAHRLIGRVVNVAATRVMGEYLQGAIERSCRERFPNSKQFFSREAVAFREGMSDNIVMRLRMRREEVIEEEKRKKHEAQSKASGDTRFALTLADVADAEEKGNYDFVHGEGAWDRRKEANERWDREYAERQARRAKAEAEAEAAYNAWAAANPEEAEKKRKEKEAEERREAKKWAKRKGPRGRYALTGREKRANSDYYDDGYRKGADVSLDQQMSSRSSDTTKRIAKS